MSEIELKKFLKSPLKFYCSIRLHFDSDFVGMLFLIIFCFLSLMLFIFLAIIGNIFGIVFSIFISLLIFSLILISFITDLIEVEKTSAYLSDLLHIDYSVLKDISKEYRKNNNLFYSASKVFNEKDAFEIVRKFLPAYLDIPPEYLTNQIESHIRKRNIRLIYNFLK